MLRKSTLFLLILPILVVMSCSGGSGVATDPTSDELRDSLNGRTNDDLGVAVSPQMLLLDSDQGGTVTVHTAIPISTVNRTSLTLNGVAVQSTYADSLGHIVANFNETLIKAIVTPPSELMVLKGKYLSGVDFVGYDTVKVAK